MTLTQEAPQQVAHNASGLIVGHDIKKAYKAGNRQIEILHGISLEVRAGEMCAIMGPSGSGKSTLLYCLAGLELPTAGESRILGQSTSSMNRSARAKMRRSDVGFVFQSYNLIPTLTAFENVALPYRLSGRKPPRELIMSTLEKVRLEDMATKRPTVMSGGEQQRVAIARVLAQQPRIVFADEPTGALDSNTGREVLADLQRIAHEADRCVLTVTHDANVAAACDRVLFLRDGLLVQEETNPTSDKVAQIMAHLDQTRTKGADR